MNKMKEIRIEKITLNIGTAGTRTLTVGNVLSTTVISGLTTTITGSHFAGATTNAADRLTAIESGTTFGLIDAAVFTVDLPTPVAGMHFRFVLIDDTTNNSITIDANGTFLYGTIVNASPAVLPVGSATTGHTTMVINTATAVTGDNIEFYRVVWKC